VDTSHESRGHKPSRHVEMFATNSVTSKRQTRLCRSNGIWPVTNYNARGKAATKSWTQIMKVGDVICVADFMICVRDKSVTLSRTCLGLFRKVGVMEFGLNDTLCRPNAAAAVLSPARMAVRNLLQQCANSMQQSADLRRKLRFAYRLKMLNVKVKGTCSGVVHRTRLVGSNMQSRFFVISEVY